MVRRSSAGVAFLLAFSAVFVPVSGARGQQSSQPRTPRQTRAPATISGRVLYSRTMKQAQGVRVRLLQSMGIPVQETFSDAEGGFTFPNLGYHAYVVEVTAEGYQTVNQQVDLTMLAGNSMRVTILLEPVAKVEVTRPPDGATTSVQELQMPPKAREAFEKGLEELNENNHPERSVAYFQKAIEIYPDYEEAYIQLGLAYHFQGQTDAAQAILERALTVDAANARAHSFLGIIYSAQEKTSKSIDAFHEAIRLDPDDWLARAELAKVLLQTGDAEEAYQQARRAQELNSRAPAANFVFADAALRRRDFQAARRVLDEFLESQPESPWAPQARQQRDNLTPLTDAVQNASLPIATRWEILMNAAQAAASQENNDQAEVFLQLAVEDAERFGPNDPRLAAALGLLASVCESQHRDHQAERHYQRSARVLENAMGPQHPFLAVTLNNLAELYRSQGRYGQAEPLYERSLDILQKTLGPNDPTLASCLNNYAALLRATDRLNEAQKLEARADAIRQHQPQ